MNEPAGNAGSLEGYPGWATTLLRILSVIMGVPTSILALVGAAWIFGIMILINIDVFGRYLFSRPLTGVPEIVSLSIVGIVFLQLANTLRQHRFIRSEMFIGALVNRHPRFGHAIEAVYHLCGAAMFAVVCAYVAPRFFDEFESGTYVGNFGLFTMLTWPFVLIILIGSALTLIQYLAHALHDVLVAAGVAPPPAMPSAADIHSGE